MVIHRYVLGNELCKTKPIAYHISNTNFRRLNLEFCYSPGEYEVNKKKFRT